jgi:hypothetical protein
MALADRWPGGGRPHFASVVVGRVAHVTDETSGPPAHDSPDTVRDTDRDTDLEAAERALADARARLLDVSAEVVVTNHVMGLYELGAIHLSADPPDLVSASLAIDAVAALVEGLGDRLGDDAATMRDALVNIRMAFVQIKSQTGQPDPGDS